MRRTTFTARFGLVSIAIAGIALLAAAEAQSGSKTSVVEDPDGDAFINFNLNADPQEAPDYLDLTGGEITLQGGIFIFKLTVAGLVPDEPFEPQGRSIEWLIGIDTDPTTFPTGFPNSPGLAFACEFNVDIFWDGTDFDAILIDRRPSLVGEDAIVTRIPFNIDVNDDNEGELTASVSSRMLDKPRSFKWAVLTDLLPPGLTVNGNFGFLPADFMPDDGFATWPAE